MGSWKFMPIFYANEEINLRLKKSKKPQNYYSTSFAGSNNSIESLNISSYTSEFGNMCLTAHANVPMSHKRQADSYVLVRRVFGTPVVHSPLTEEEAELLKRFDFCPLEYTTASQMEQELCFLKRWSSGRDKDLKETSDELIQLRAKELKHMIATNYIDVKKNLYDGYKILDRYFQEISRYNRR